MQIGNKRKRILQNIRTDHLYKFILPESNVYYLVNKKPINVNQWFGYNVDDDITYTYIAFVVYVEGTTYKIDFQFIHKINNRRNILEYVYKRSATLNNLVFFVNLLYKAPLINFEEI